MQLRMEKLSKETKTFLRGTRTRHTIRSFLVDYTPEQHTGFVSTQKTLNLTGRSRQRKQDRVNVIHNFFLLFFTSFILKLTIKFYLLVKPSLKVIFRVIPFRLEGPQAFSENPHHKEKQIHPKSIVKCGFSVRKTNKQKNNVSIRFRCFNSVLDSDALT